MSEELRILGLAEGDPWTSVTLSGAPASLFGALDRRFAVVERLDYGLRGSRRVVQAAWTFRPRRSDWVARFHLTPQAHRALTASLQERLQRVGQQFDLAFQVYGWVAGQPRPYCLYVDQTRTQIEAGWPKLLPMSREARAEGRRLERAMYEGANHIFVMGKSARESLIADYGIVPDRVDVVGGAPHFDSLPAPKAEPVTEPQILFVGREFERKGGDVLLEAFARVRTYISSATLHVVGPRRRLTQPGVISHGRVSDRSRVARLFDTARLVCLPSLYEPWGFVLAEAMAHSRPCVGTTVGSIPEILDHGRAGLLVPPGDADALAQAIVALLRDDDLAHRLGTEGRARVERLYTWDRVVESMAPILNSARKPLPPPTLNT